MRFYRRAKKQILAAALTFVVAFAWSMDTSFQQLVKIATPWEIRAAIKRGADVKARDKDGKTAFDYAIENKQL